MDFQATEIFEYAQKLGGVSSCLSNSLEFQKCRFEYASLLNEYGGFNTNVSQYCEEIYKCICNNSLQSTQQLFISKLFDLHSFATGEFNQQIKPTLDLYMNEEQHKNEKHQPLYNAPPSSIFYPSPQEVPQYPIENFTPQIEHISISENFHANEQNQQYENEQQQKFSYAQINYSLQDIPQNYNAIESFTPQIENVSASENFHVEEESQQFEKEKQQFYYVPPPSNFYPSPPDIPQYAMKSFSPHIEPVLENLQTDKQSQNYEFQNNSELKKNQKEENSNDASTEGLFGGWKKKIVKMIPLTNQMILPDDKNPTVCFYLFLLNSFRYNSIKTLEDG